jgi:hypothetical protein
MRWLFLLLILICHFVGSLEIFGQENSKTIAVFFASNETIPGYKRILEGFQASYSKKSGPKYNLLI